MEANHRRPVRGTRQVMTWIMLAIVVAAMWIVGRPAAHLTLVAWRDSDSIDPVPRGFTDDASRLNQTRVNEVIDIESNSDGAERQLKALLARARRDQLNVSIAGARHTMGGHTIAPDGIVLDMRSFNAFTLDERTNILHVQAGAMWDRIIPYLDVRGRSVEIMQSNNSFTVGGSISANCHGWQPNRPPIASSVRSIRVMTADGSILVCSRDQNAELFSLALGGYGLFGIILDVELQVVRNERYALKRFVVNTENLPGVFEREVRKNMDVGMAYGRLCVSHDKFLEQAIVNVFVRSPCETAEIPALAEPSMTSLKRAVFRGSVDSDYGKDLRWEAELMLSDRLSQTFVSRNQLLSDPVDLYQNHAGDSTDILHEYFVPPEEFGAFVVQLQTIIPRHGADLLNVTIRHVMEDEISFLRYADREMLSLVLLFNQPRTPEADAAMERLTQEIIDAALTVGGRYYLPYRLHATQEEFEKAYPQSLRFFELKSQYDPQHLFQNQFYLKYGVAR